MSAKHELRVRIPSHPLKGRFLRKGGRPLFLFRRCNRRGSFTQEVVECALSDRAHFLFGFFSYFNDVTHTEFILGFNPNFKL
jgi:hypothetical protein